MERVSCSEGLSTSQDKRLKLEARELPYIRHVVEAGVVGHAPFWHVSLNELGHLLSPVYQQYNECQAQSWSGTKKPATPQLAYLFRSSMTLRLMALRMARSSVEDSWRQRLSVGTAISGLVQLS
jgi:hypothetical protein